MFLAYNSNNNKRDMEQLPKLQKATSACEIQRRSAPSSKKNSNGSLQNTALAAKQLKEERSRSKVEVALHELNQCAVFNQWNDHRQALNHAEQAIVILEQEVLALRSKIESASAHIVVTEAEKMVFHERMSLLSIAYYNKGCECEHLKKMIKATQAFSRAVNLQSGRHGNQDLLKQFKLSLKQAKYKLRQQMMTTSTSQPPRQKSHAQGGQRSSPVRRNRPGSANFHFGQEMQLSRNMQSFQTEQNCQLPGIQSRQQVEIPVRPNSALNRQFQTEVVLNASVPVLQNEKSDELAIPKRKFRKHVLSEYDAHADATSAARGVQNTAMLQMMLRPPRKGAQQSQNRKQRGARQASQRRQSTSPMRQKPGMRSMTNGTPQHPLTLFQVVDEVISSIEEQKVTMSAGGIQSRCGLTSPTENKGSLGLYQLSKTSKKLIDRGGPLSLGSQTLFQPTPSVVLSHNKSFSVKKDSGQLQQAVTSHVTNLVNRINQQQLELSKPVLGKKVASPKIKDEDMTEEQRKLAQIKKKAKLSKNRKVMKAAIEWKKQDNILSDQYKQFFESKKDLPEFQKACKLIQRVVRCRKFRRVSRKLTEKVKADQNLMIVRVVTKVQAMFRRKRDQKRVEFFRNQKRIEANFTLMKHVVKIQSLFRRNQAKKLVIGKKLDVQLNKWKSDPRYIKAATMMQCLVRRRRARQLVEDIMYLQKIRKDPSMMDTVSNLQHLFRRQRAKKIVEAAMKLHKETEDSQYLHVANVIQTKSKRHRFASISYNNLYLKRIQNEPRRLQHIIWVQSTFRKQKAKRLVYKMYWQNKMKDPKFANACRKIQCMYRRWKMRRVAYKLLTERRRGNLKFERATIQIQCMFRRRRARKLVYDLMERKKRAKTRMAFVESVVKIQSLYRRNRDKKKVDLLSLSSKIRKNFTLMWQVVKIQRAFRRMRARRTSEPYDCAKRRFDKAFMHHVSFIQRFYRRHRLRNMIMSVVYLNRRKASKLIAGVMRKRKARKLVNKVIKDNQAKAKELEKAEAGQDQIKPEGEVKAEKVEEPVAKVEEAVQEETTKGPPLNQDVAPLLSAQIAAKNDECSEVANEYLDQLARDHQPQLHRNEGSFTEVASEATRKMQLMQVSKEAPIKTITSQDGPSNSYELTLHPSQATLVPDTEKLSLIDTVKDKMAILMNDNLPIIEKQHQAAVRIQIWIRHMLLRIKARKIFSSAIPVCIRTIKRIGYFFKVVCLQTSETKLVFKMVTLPQKRSKQELVADLPSNLSVFFSKLSYAEHMIQQIEVSLMGKASFAPDAVKKAQATQAQMSFEFAERGITFGNGKSEPPMSPELAAVQSKETIESVILSPTLLKDDNSFERNRLSHLHSKRSQQTIQANASPIALATPQSQDDSLITEMAPKLLGTISVDQQRVTIETASKVSQIDQQSNCLPSASDHPKSSKSKTNPDSDVAMGRLQNRPPSGANSNSATKQVKVQSKKKSSSNTAHFSQTVGENIYSAGGPRSNTPCDLQFNSDRPSSSYHSQCVKQYKHQAPKAIEKQQKSSHKEGSSVQSQSAYRIMLEPAGHSTSDLKICFQPAVVKKKNFLMVTLFKQQTAMDRKILPIDIYSGTMAVGLFDMDQFCKIWLMPCLTIKEKGKSKLQMEVNEQLLSELQRKCDSDESVRQQQPPVQPVLTQSSIESKQMPPSQFVHSFGQQEGGQLPLIKRTQMLDQRPYSFQAVFDFDQNVIKFNAERSSEALSLNLQVAEDCQKDMQLLHRKAEEIVNQLTITDNGLEVRRADKGVIRDDNVVYRTGKNMKGSFYLVAIGFSHGQLVIEAYDKQKEQRLVLRLDWSNTAEQKLAESESNEIIDKLDVMEIAANLVLVIR